MVEFVLCLVGGMFGLHKFYNKDYKKGLLYLFTVGLFTFGWLYDTIRLGIELMKDYTAPEGYEARQLQKKEARELAIAQREQAIREEQERIATMDREGTAYCPRCKGTSVQYVERRKQLSLGRAVVGSAINPLAGAVGAVTSKKYKGLVKCLKCGHGWNI